MISRFKHIASQWSPRRRTGAVFALIAACAVNALICASSEHLAPDFVLLSQPVVLFWTAVGGAGILATFAWLRTCTHHPLGWLQAACAAALVITILPDVALLVWRAPWFGPYTTPAVLVLMLLHATCAATVLLCAPLWAGAERGAK